MKEGVGVLGRGVQGVGVQGVGVQGVGVLGEGGGVAGKGYGSSEGRGISRGKGGTAFMIVFLRCSDVMGV